MPCKASILTSPKCEPDPGVAWNGSEPVSDPTEDDVHGEAHRPKGKFSRGR